MKERPLKIKVINLLGLLLFTSLLWGTQLPYILHCCCIIFGFLMMFVSK